MQVTVEPVAAQQKQTWIGAATALAAAGWGANQFVPMIVAYRTSSGLSGSESNAVYGLYALGLVPALLLGGRISDRIGRRRVLMPALLVTALASVLLMFGGDDTEWLFIGRLLTGIGSGLVFSTGVAWVKELSVDVGPAAGARRATIAITAGFGAGPLVSGLLAQWLPNPLVTAYVPHVVLALIAMGAVRRAPEHAPQAVYFGQEVPGAGQQSAKPPAASAGLARAFLTFFVPFAPWVFGGAAVSLAYLIPIAAREVGGLALLYCAVVATLGAAAGIVAQPLAKAMYRPGSPRLVIGAMGIMVIGLAGGAWAAAAASPLLVMLDALILGVGYGVCQFCGLLTVQRVAKPASLGTAIAGFQVLSYVGFAFPYLMSVIEERWAVSPGIVVLGLTAVAAVCAVIAASTRVARG